MLKFLEANWWFLGVVLAMAIGLWWRLLSLESDIKEHLDPKNDSPHPACPVHGSKFAQMQITLQRIEQTMDKLDSRIYEFMRSNGFHKEDK